MHFYPSCCVIQFDLRVPVARSHNQKEPGCGGSKTNFDFNLTLQHDTIWKCMQQNNNKVWSNVMKDEQDDSNSPPAALSYSICLLHDNNPEICHHQGQHVSSGNKDNSKRKEQNKI